jgi:hypothetical protein
MADGFLIEDSIAAPDEHDGAGKFLVGNRLAHERLDAVEAPGVDRDWRGWRRARSGREDVEPGLSKGGFSTDQNCQRRREMYAHRA